MGLDNRGRYEHELARYARQRLEAVEGLRIIGTAANTVGVVSFVVEQPAIAAIDIAMRLSREGIAVRTGHHCCMPLMDALNVPGTCRASLAMYNTAAEIDRLCEVLDEFIAERGERGTHVTSQGEPISESTSTVRFAAAFAASPAAAADELTEEFLLFDDLESKTEFLLELGDELPDTFATLKAISTPVHGCMSEVYLVGRPSPDQLGKYEFIADSNAQVVRGLISLLLKLFSGQSPQAIAAFDIESFFRRIGLDQFVSSQRRSGLNGMIRRIRDLVATS